MGFTLKAAQEFGIPEVMLFTTSGCGTLGYLHYEDLKERGYFPLKDEDCLSNGYLDTAIDWIPEMRGIRLKDLPTFLRSTDENDIMFNYSIESVNNAVNARAIVLNTFDDLEEEVLEAIKIKYPNLYTIGPLSMLNQQLPETKLETVESNLWKEDNDCLRWLDKREPNSVVYVNFGSLIIMTSDQLSEFAWGLANSMYSFLWIIRSNLVDGGVNFVSLVRNLKELTDIDFDNVI
ncbi:7-deoxyloganetin glucosyltransferase-like [Quercus suber]|uniref:7-deoxyloganetin glucosyltransferase-like n=1 Tax=Quercus suber TaxID=58331 RepID=UPI0032DF96C7